MSVLIKGMEMPTCCFKCGFYHHSVDDGYYDFEYCGANNAEFNNAYDSAKPHINPFEEKLSTCPLVHVPPHGDLIDRNKLYEKTAEWEAQALHMVEVTMNDEDTTEWRKWSTILTERSAFKFDVADTPTIIPEEEK